MKRTFRILLALTILLLLYCGTAQARDPITLTSDMTTWADNDYVVEGDVTIEGQVTAKGYVNLRVSEGSTLTITGGIVTKSGRDSQFMDIYGPGALICNSSIEGGTIWFSSANVTVHGADNKAAIGGSEIRIHSGNITVYGGKGGDGINGGDVMEIRGANITAYGGENGAGIGGGSGKEIEISNSTVHAYGGKFGAGIGSHRESEGCTITIENSTVIAQGGEGEVPGTSTHGNGGGGGAGIGSGGGSYSNTIPGNCGTITITNSNVTATGSVFGSGIGAGGGYFPTHGGSGGNITINGGHVTATSEMGYGIGAAKGNGDGAKGNITLNWKQTSDYIYASSYRGNIEFTHSREKDGKEFVLENTITVANENNINGAKLVPITFKTVHIKNEANWNEVCENLQLHEYVEAYLDNDVSLSSSAGMLGSDEVPFSGVFHGQGHTLTVNINDSNYCSAPFSHVKGVIIENLKVGGSVTGGRHCSGLVGGASGTNQILNCKVSAAISTTNSYCGGFVGHGGQSATTLSGCIFSGSISGATRAGTFWGWSDEGASPVLTDCMDFSSSSHPIGLGYPSNPTVSNTYYTYGSKTTGQERPWTNRGQRAYTVQSTDDRISAALNGKPGQTIDGMIYAGGGETISLMLSILVPENVHYSVNAGTLTADGDHYSLVMPGSDVAISLVNWAGQCGDQLFYTMDTDYHLVITGTGAMWDFDQEISPWSCGTTSSRQTPVTELTLSSDITHLGNYAFAGSSMLTEVSLPAHLESIGTNVFKECAITALTVPDSVSSIGGGAFRSCAGLASITLPRQLGSGVINEYTFSGCRSLSSIELPENITSIGKAAFESCSGLTSFTLPDCITEIADETFSGCSSLTDINLPEGLTRIGRYAFAFCGALKNPVFPSSLRIIDTDAYCFCNRLTSIVLNDGLERIGDYAFSYCGGIESFTADVSVLGPGALAGCSSLQSVVLKPGLTEIGRSAFNNDRVLESITIPDTLKKVGKEAFNQCYGLTSITMPAGMDEIGEYAFEYCSNLESFTGGASVIGDYAFQYCGSLQSVTLLSGTTKIGKYAFHNLPTLTSVTLPEGLKEIGEAAFTLWEYNVENSSLTNVVLPSTLEKVGKNAFYKVKGRITSAPGMALNEVGDKAFYDCTGFEGSIWNGDPSKTLATLGEYAFYNCSSMTGGVNLAGGMRVEPYTFYQCSSLTQLKLNKHSRNNNIIEEYAFYGCSGLAGDLELPVYKIGDYAFAGCTGLSSMTHTLKWYSGTIGRESFAGCTGLTSIDLFWVCSIGNGAFRNCTALENAALPDAMLETMGSSVFEGCVRLKNIRVPYIKAYSNKGFSVPDSSFSGCTALETAFIPSGAKEIKADAFNGCSELKTVWIPAGMQTIRQGAFRNCNKLKDVYYGGTEEQWNAISIDLDNYIFQAQGLRIHFGSEYIAEGTVNILPSEHGTITPEKTSRYYIGDIYYFYVTADPGYHLKEVHATDSCGRETLLDYEDEDGQERYCFEFQSWSITLSAVFEPDFVSSESSPCRLTAANMPLTLKEGWYELTENATVNTRLIITGDVSLHVNSGVTLNCLEGIEVKAGDSLTISGNGTINADASTRFYPAIGGTCKISCGTVIINGCTVNAISSDSVGIGSGYKAHGGTVIINGGTVNATGFQDEGIGSGRVELDDCTVIINGGTVTASSRKWNRVSSAISSNASIKDGLMVTVLSTGDTALYDDRLSACATPGVRIEPCDHSGEVELDNEGQAHCLRCGAAGFISGVGDGSAEHPWSIGTEARWNELASLIENGGLNAAGTHFLLTSDISVSTMMGTEAHPFTGTFNGAGHTLTFTAADAPNDCAPFRYIQDALISNLHIAGTIQTGNRWAAGLAANALGTCRITNCRSSVNIQSTHSGDGSHAGFVSVIAEGGSLTMNGCLFDGSITGAATTNCGGFTAYARNSITIRNSLCAPSAYNTTGNSQNFVRWTSGCTVTIENSYYTDIAVSAQGRYGYPVTAGEGVTLDFGSGTVYSVSGITAYPAGILCGGVFCAGEEETVSLTPGCELMTEPGAVPHYIASSGELVLTDAGYTLTLADEPPVISVEFSALFDGAGTADNPWLIDSAERWNTLAETEGLDTTGKTFRLTEDISVTTMLGSGTTRFKGTFDGTGHTLTVNLDSENAAAPFAGINGATIRNLRVTGSVNGGSHSAGLVAGAAGANLIENCAISVSVNCTGSHCGGIVGHGGTSSTTLRGCVFSGSISGATRVGTLWGWSDSGAQVTIEYCLDVSSSPYPIGLGYDDPSNNLVDVYYTNAEKEPGTSRSWKAPGKQAHTVTAGAGVTLDFGYDEEYSVSGIQTCGSAGLKYNGVFYAGENDILGIYAELSEGWLRPVTVNAGDLQERGPGFCFLIMPDDDVVVSAMSAAVFSNADFRLPAGISAVEVEAFEGGAMRVVNIPDGCRSIGDHAFRNCRDLTMIRIPADCRLGEDVFAGCEMVYIYGYFTDPISDAQQYCYDHQNCEFILLELPQE